MKKWGSILKKYISLAIVHTFNMFPIKNNKVFLLSYYGSQYGCSPKYISEYMVKNYPKENFDIVWAFNDIASKQSITGVRKVKTMTLRYFYELCTSKVIITNFRTTNIFVKRKNQYYIQTWHSSLRLKQIEMDAANSLPTDYVEMAKKDSLKCDLLLSGCKYSTQIFKRAFWYEGEIFEHGTPRNDIFFQHNGIDIEIIRNKLNISKDIKIVLYAPTFRKGNELDVYNLDYQRIANKLEDKFGGKWAILVKLHPHLLSRANQLIQDCNVINVTSYDDIQELLSISDILITDYSSLMFDFALTDKPCFLYVPDIVEYTSKDRNLYFDIEQLPFISATCNDDLIVEIENFNYKKYSRGLKNFTKQIGTFERGKACKKLVNRINKVCYN